MNSSLMGRQQKFQPSIVRWHQMRLDRINSVLLLLHPKSSTTDGLSRNMYVEEEEYRVLEGHWVQGSKGATEDL